MVFKNEDLTKYKKKRNRGLMSSTTVELNKRQQRKMTKKQKYYKSKLYLSKDNFTSYKKTSYDSMYATIAEYGLLNTKVAIIYEIVSKTDNKMPCFVDYTVIPFRSICQYNIINNHIREYGFQYYSDIILNGGIQNYNINILDINESFDYIYNQYSDKYGDEPVINGKIYYTRNDLIPLKNEIIIEHQQ